MARTRSGSSASVWISGFVVVITVLTSFALLGDLRAPRASAAEEQAFLVDPRSTSSLPGSRATTPTTQGVGAAAAATQPEATAAVSAPSTVAPQAPTTTVAPAAPATPPSSSTQSPGTTAPPTTAAPAPSPPPSSTTTTQPAPAPPPPSPQPVVSGVPGANFMPATTPYTGPMTIRSGNQPDGGLIIRGFEISGALTIDAGRLPYIVIADNYWHIPAAPGKAVKIVSTSSDIQVFHNRFDGLQPNGSTVVGDVVAINSTQGLSHAEVYENLFVDIGSGGGGGTAAHTDIIVTFHAEMNVRRNRFARVGRLSSAIFYQSINGPTWGVVENNVILGDNHLIRAQSRKSGSGDLIVRGNTLDGPVSWIDPTWEGHLVWTDNSGGFDFHAA